MIIRPPCTADIHAALCQLAAAPAVRHALAGWIAGDARLQPASVARLMRRHLAQIEHTAAGEVMRLTPRGWRLLGESIAWRAMPHHPHPGGTTA